MRGMDSMIPDYLAGENLREAMENLPIMDENLKSASVEARMTALNSLYDVYIPTNMSVAIYNKLYFSLKASMEKKNSHLALQQRYANHAAIRGGVHQGVIGGSDSFSIIGSSGIGKSAAIGRALSLIGRDDIYSLTNPYCLILPALAVQTPFDCSPKGMLLEILRSADERLETHYYQSALRARATQDMLIGSVSEICLNHIGLLIVDEIQNVIESKNGKTLVGLLTQLINASGVSICFVGTPEAAGFFEQTPYLARRTIGLHCGPLEYAEEFCTICDHLLDYTCTARGYSDKQALCRAAYEYSGGTISTVITLLHDAQEIAIMNGREILDLRSMDDAWRQRMGMMHACADYGGKTGRKHLLSKKEAEKRGQQTAKTNQAASQKGRIMLAGTAGQQDKILHGSILSDNTAMPKKQINMDDPLSEVNGSIQAGNGSDITSLLSDLAVKSEQEGTDLISLLSEHGLLETEVPI